MADLPSLNALHAFEVAARHLSFTRAAEELHVTQGAVSHQVRGLEEEIGLRLFERRHRQIALTEEGRRLAQAVGEGFGRIEDALSLLTVRSADHILQVSVSPSLATRWLVPRLAGFNAQHSELDIRISATDALVDPVREQVDLCIRYGKGGYPRLTTTLLSAEDVFPVCHPSLARGRGGLRSPADLARHTLLHDDMFAGDRDRPDWRKWLRAAGARGVKVTGGQRFSHAGLALEAAVAGHGVALGRTSLVADDLQRGTLVRPFPVSFRSRMSYWLVTPAGSQARERTRPLREWLEAQARPASVPTS
jgi:LysR family glycine cleavage system transcriptional activator